ncbi:dolichyl-P-Man:Man(5)GlcNAc(2)-PP-dolichol alpha-1,3-mannosyltransferase [Blomia tropicalis]|nr:dolichyl-P-Man:Man(5)GlcNAc(2)-PP-dolichol alpha-1,3-mannosyltransferase [Blomia tropicalis]
MYDDELEHGKQMLIRVMAPLRSSKTKNSNTVNKILNFIRKPILSGAILTNRSHFNLIATLFLILELFINLFIINYRKYTEIDWSTYMQQVECFLNGTLNYEKIGGDTGPIVYPAGHLYIYTILYFITNRGKNLYFAQHIFGLLYIGTIWLVFKIYSKHSKVPPYVLLFMCLTSHRVHSIFVLRLFNDPIAIFLFYVSLYYFVQNKWTIGCAFYSLAVSVKMNILLFAPALFLVLVENHSKLFNVVQKLAICAIIQIVLGLPFLMTYPISYIRSSFNLGRVFLHQWTVNYRFLPEDIFVDKYFHLSLLTAHIAVLLAFFFKRWITVIRKLLNWILLRGSSDKINRQPNGSRIVLTMFIANLIGITFARSLHYQFYNLHMGTDRIVLECLSQHSMEQWPFTRTASVDFDWPIRQQISQWIRRQYYC